MNIIETICILILLFMGVPGLSARFGRRAMASSIFVLSGCVLAPLLQKEVTAMLLQAGKIGFLLVLFEVGGEINLPKFNKLIKPLTFAAGWALLQYPLIVGIAMLTGLSLAGSLLIAAALTGCSMSMAYAAWKHYVGLPPSDRQFFLQLMVSLEMITMAAMAVGTPALIHGLHWIILAKLAGIAATIYLISRFANHLTDLFEHIVGLATHWRINLLILLVLLVSAVGERLGLSGAKAAFFFGLFINRSRYVKMNIEEHMAPVSKRFLIPLFFVSLGLAIDWKHLLHWTSLVAIGTGFLLLGLRQLIHRIWFRNDTAERAFLLFCPNLTMAALAANSLLEIHRQAAASWVLLCSMTLTITSLWMLPRADGDGAEHEEDEDDVETENGEIPVSDLEDPVKSKEPSSKPV